MVEIAIIAIALVALFFCARPVIKGISRRHVRERQAVTPMTFHAIVKAHSLHALDVRNEHPQDVEVAFVTEGNFESTYLFYVSEAAAGAGFNEHVCRIKRSFDRQLPAQTNAHGIYTALTDDNFYEVSLIKQSLLIVKSPAENMEEAKKFVSALGFGE